MKPTDLSKYKKERFAKSRFCSICGGIISDTDDIEYEVHKYGHWKRYFFMHWGCLNVKAEKTTKSTEGLVSK